MKQFDIEEVEESKNSHLLVPENAKKHVCSLIELLMLNKEHAARVFSNYLESVPDIKEKPASDAADAFYMRLPYYDWCVIVPEDERPVEVISMHDWCEKKLAQAATIDFIAKSDIAYTVISTFANTELWKERSVLSIYEIPVIPLSYCCAIDETFSEMQRKRFKYRDAFDKHAEMLDKKRAEQRALPKSIPVIIQGL